MELKYCQISAFEEALRFVLNYILNEVIKIIVISVVYEVC